MRDSTRTVQWHDHIPVGPLGCHGKACIRGTRVMVSVVLDNLAAGESRDDIAEAYGDVQAALLYAAGLRLGPCSAAIGPPLG